MTVDADGMLLGSRLLLVSGLAILVEVLQGALLVVVMMMMMMMVLVVEVVPIMRW